MRRTTALVIALFATGACALFLSVTAGLMIGLFGFVLMISPRERLPWNWGWLRWLLGEYQCDVCENREGFGPARDLRSGDNFRVMRVEVMGKRIIIGQQAFEFTGNVDRYFEIRCCGDHSLRRLLAGADVLYVHQPRADDSVEMWFGSSATRLEAEHKLPAVPYRLAVRTLARLTGISRIELEQKVQLILI